MTQSPGPNGVTDPAGAAAQRWRDDLAVWRIPQEILDQAPQSPWIHPVTLFVAQDGPVPDSPSHRRAREVVPAAGSVLDVGCGGGRAAFALVPPAATVVGVDHQEAMLEEFAAAAGRRGVDHVEVLGDWPDVEGSVPVADVAVAHHVAYNVPDLAGFAQALTAHARRRVVLELPEQHPLAGMAPLWAHFWGLERPQGPTAQDAAAVLRAAGLDVTLESWVEEGPRRLDAVTPEQQVEFMRIRLCLPASRDAEVAEVLDRFGPTQGRRLVTLWWNC